MKVHAKIPDDVFARHQETYLLYALQKLRELVQEKFFNARLETTHLPGAIKCRISLQGENGKEISDAVSKCFKYAFGCTVLEQSVIDSKSLDFSLVAIQTSPSYSLWEKQALEMNSLSSDSDTFIRDHAPFWGTWDSVPSFVERLTSSIERDAAADAYWQAFSADDYFAVSNIRKYLPPLLSHLEDENKRINIHKVIDKVLDACIKKQSYCNEADALREISRLLAPCAHIKEIRLLLEKILSNVSNCSVARIIAEHALGLRNAYHDFYLQFALEDLRQTYAKSHPHLVLSLEGDKIRVQADPLKGKMPENVYRNTGIFCLRRIQISDQEALFAIDHDNPDYYHRSPLDMALKHDDPVKFLLDHSTFWSFMDKEMISWLSQEGRLSHPNVVPFLCDNLQKKEQAKDLPSTINALGKALTLPASYPFTRSALLRFIVCEDHKWEHRLLAATQLISFLDSDQEIKITFNVLANTDPRIQLRVGMRSVLDQTVYSTSRLKTFLIQDILLSDIFNGVYVQVNKEQSSFLEYLAFSYPEPFYEALCQLGEEPFVNFWLEAFKLQPSPATEITGFRGMTPLGGLSAHVRESSYSYSMLKFLASLTQNPILQNAILDALRTKCEGKNLGMLQDLDDCFTDIQHFGKLPLPSWAADKIKNAPHWKTLTSALAPLSRESDAKAVFKSLLDASLHLIEDESKDPLLRKLAIRDMSQYIFDRPEYGASMWRRYSLDDKIWPAIEKAARSSDPSVQEEASLFLSWKIEKTDSSL